MLAEPPLQGHGIFYFTKPMKKFIEAMRDLKSRPQELKCRLVWNQKTNFFKNNNWLVTTTFSKEFIERFGLEVVYEKNLILN